LIYCFKKIIFGGRKSNLGGENQIWGEIFLNDFIYNVYKISS